jgi:hypothetical protein
MKAPSGLDIISWYCTALLAGFAAIAATYVLALLSLLVFVDYRDEINWRAVWIAIELAPLAMFVPFGMIAYRWSNGVRGAHLVCAYALGALLPIAYGASGLWTRLKLGDW